MEAWLYVCGGVVFEWGVAFLSVGAGLCECEGVALEWGRGFVGAEAWLLSGGVAVCVEGVAFEWGVAECRGVAFCVGAGLCECEGVALEWGRGLCVRRRGF